MIVPRWEWRTFGDDLGDAERRLDALTPTKVEDSEEVYVLSRRTEASVKVRDGQLDVKRLERVTVDGLQQWRPVAKADLPVAATELRVAARGAARDRAARSRARHTTSSSSSTRSSIRTTTSWRFRCTSIASTTSWTGAWPS